MRKVNRNCDMKLFMDMNVSVFNYVFPWLFYNLILFV